MIGIIGGSGLYELDGLEQVEQIELDTPYGKPSDVFVRGKLQGKTLLFLSRHGRGHRLLPSEVNYRANVYGMKMLGAKWLVSVSAVGSMREEIHPGHFVFPDQFIDLTKNRPQTFFGNGIVGHIAFADPICPHLAKILADAALACGITVHRGGTYVCIEGPQFSTRAESHLYRSWGVSIIGMTNMPEARLAREAEISYATMALATDYDCWHETEADVSVEAVLAIMHKNVANARKVLSVAISQLSEGVPRAAQGALQHAILTDRRVIPQKTLQELEPLLGGYISKEKGI